MRGKHKVMEEFLKSRHICSRCTDGDCDSCNGSARLPDELHPCGIGSKAPCPSFTVCECDCNLAEAV